MQKKLLIVTDFAYPIGGGTERHVFHLAKYFSEKYNVTMLAPSWGDAPSETSVEGIKIKKFFSRGKDRIFKNLFYSLKLNPDIVWSHYVLPSISVLPLKFFGKKIIAMLHDFENVRAPYTYFLNLCDRIIVHTNLLRERAIEQGINPNKIEVIPGIIDSVFIQKNLKNKYDVVGVFRICHHKGIDIFLQVVKENPKLRFCLVGRFMPEEKSMWSKEIAKLKNVDYFGYVSDEELVNLLNQSKVFLICSRKEGFCLGAVEAMACGLPVVSSDTNGLKEAVGNYGIITKNYSEAINRLLTNRRKYEKYCNLSLQRAELLRFSVLMKKYDAVLESL